MVILLALEDGAGAVELFDEDEADHLMRERHLGERDLVVGALIDGGRKAVGATDDEHESAGGLLLLAQPFGKFDAAALAAMLIEKDDGILRGEFLEDEVALALLLLRLAQGAGVLEFGDDEDVKGHVVADAVGIVGYRRLIQFVSCFTDENKK